MGISQGTISKIESAQLVPNMVQWYKFCNIININPDETFDSGLVTIRPKKDQPHKFKMGKKKSPLKILSSELILMVHFLFESEYELDFKKFLKENSIDSDIFYALDIHMQITVLTLIETFVHEHNINEDFIFQNLFDSPVYNKVLTPKKYTSKMNERSSIFNFDLEENVFQVNNLEINKSSSSHSVSINFS